MRIIKAILCGAALVVGWGSVANADVVLGTAPQGIRGLYIYEGQIYVTDNAGPSYGSIYRLPVTGGVPQLFANNTGPHGDEKGPSDLIFGSGAVYFDGGNYVSNQIQSIPTSGGTVKQISPIFSGGYLSAINGSYLYYGTGFDAIDRISVTGGNPTQVASGFWVRRHVYDGTDMYFQDYNTNDIYSFNFSTHAIKDLLSGIPHDSVLQQDTNNLYLGLTPISSSPVTEIERIAKTGGVATPILTNQDIINYVIGSGEIYYTDGTSIYGIPTSGGTSNLIDSVNGGGIRQLSLYGGNIYYSKGSSVYQVTAPSDVPEPSSLSLFLPMIVIGWSVYKKHTHS